MVVTMLSAVAKADTTGGSSTTGTTDNSGLVLDKTATLEDDGTYTINLEAYATGTTVTTTTDVAVPLDIVMVIDQSASMKNDMPALKTAVHNFANTIAEKANHDQVDHRIALVGFASDGSHHNYEWTGTGIFLDGVLKKYAIFERNEDNKVTNEKKMNLSSLDYKNALVLADGGNGELDASIDNAIDSFNASGATCINYGMEMTKNIFENNPILPTENRQRVVVVFSDGEPTSWNGFESKVANEALDDACTIKNTTNDGYGAKIYTVGLYDDPDDEVLKFMNALSSNYQDVKEYTDSRITIPTVEYNKVYRDSINTNRRYRIYDGSSYKTVWYCNYGSNNSAQDAGWYTSRTWSDNLGSGGDYRGTGTKYTPKTDSNDGKGTQFYKKEVTDSVGYLKIASDADQLNAIFQSISQSATTSSTKVELTANAVMRDILGTGFKLPYTDATKGNNIVVKTCIVTMDSSGKVTEGDSTTTSQSLTNTVKVDEANDYYALDVTGFDYKEKYVSSGHPGEKLKVTIKGVVATDDAITNDLVDTNNRASGIYESAAATAVVKNFPQPKTILSNKSYVLDYGKKVDFEAGDWKQDRTTHLALDMKGFSQTVNKLTQSTSSTVKYGEAEIAGTAKTLTYKPQKINWDGYDSFYAFGKVDKNDAKVAEINKLSTGLNANSTENIWSKINVIPATSVYYEDDFMTSSTSKDGGVKIQYAGDWKVVNDDDTEKSEKTDTTPDSNDKQSSENKVYGFDGSYDAQLGHSGGSAHYVTGKWDENKNLTSTATFTFTGTGVDVYSRTTMESGMVQMDVYKGTSVGKDGEQVYVGVENGYWSSEKGLYQIPTLFVKDLAYGTYTVQLTVYAKDEFCDKDVYYLDGIRIYEPLKNPEKKDTTIQQAYEEAFEGASMIATVREILLSAEELTQETTANGVVYMDEVGNSDMIDEYKKVGPKNEVYLSENNGIAFHVKGMEEDSKVYIGLKAPQRLATAVLVTDGDKMKTITINSSADRYYEVTPNANGNIVIKNTGTGLLSITKIRVTNVETYNDNARIQYTPQLLSDIRKFSSLKQAETVTENKTTQSMPANKSLNVTINQAEPLQENDSKEEEAVWNSIKNSAARWLSRQ